jgi:hypothetical protein
MQQKLGGVHETLHRVHGFLDANDTRFTAINESKARKNLDAVIAQFSAQAADQVSGDSGSKGETARQRELRLALRMHFMSAVARAAKVGLRDVPEFKTFTLPDAHVKGPALIAAAEAMLASAKKYEELLIDAGLPVGWIGGLQTAIENMRTSLDIRDAHRERRIGATANLALQAKTARSTIRLLDALVRQAIGNDPGLLAQWKVVKRIPRKPGPVTGSVAQAEVVAQQEAPAVPETPKAA